MASTLEVLTAAQAALLLNKPTATLYQTTSQNIANGGTYSAITFQTAVGDIWSGWSSGNPTVWTVPVAGTYLVSAATCWAGNSSGNRFHIIDKNSVEIPGSKTEQPGSSAGAAQSIQGPTTTVAANVGDTISLLAAQTSSTNPLGTYAGDPDCSLVIVFLHL